MAESLAFGLFAALPLVSAALIALVVRFRRVPGTAPGWVRLLLSNLLVGMLLLSFVGLAGETYYRWFHDTTDALSYTKASARWFLRHWRENRLAVRDNIDYFPRSEPGKRRVTFVGDSFLAAHGIEDVEDRIPNRIRRAHPEWEVHVAAKPGFETADELNFLKELTGLGYELDHVVLVYCLNDLSDLLPEWNAAYEAIFPEGNPAGWLRRNSYFIDTLYHRLRVMRNPYVKDYFGVVAKAYQGEVWEQQQERLRDLRDFVHSHGGRLSVVTFPFLHALGPAYAHQAAHDELARFWRESGVPHLDLLPLYRELPSRRLTVNRTDAHPSVYANALATPLIETFVSEELDRAEALQEHADE